MPAACLSPTDPAAVAAVAALHRHWRSPSRVGKYPPIFPGPMPVSIERRHFGHLRSKPYMVCEKTDGVRHALVCVDKRAFLINRRLDVYAIANRFMPGAYKGTVADCELVRTTDDELLLSIYDAVAFKGEYVGTKNLTDRLAVCAAIAKCALKVKSDAIAIRAKPMVPLKQMRALVERDFPYETDGYVFTPVAEPVRVGTHETMFKWKPRASNTVDFQVKLQDDLIKLYVQEKGALVFETHVDPAKLTKKWRKALVEDAIVECRCVADRWEPQNIRADKTYPNSRRTFYRTIVNINENIKREEFVKLAKHV